ncbi:hypothetical protein QC764_403680 [Podospora pseudoanserina]|uniref:Nephrocystin 3-like N-terminal domain-containing protein n=1 Tax=Podospora pseudoanserina TaxID=2609844 RepID=A0ABR0I900_9PEZI|nr:hypothetical protein QC764_403680 [Podospora pseudoanserina]
MQHLISPGPLPLFGGKSRPQEQEQLLGDVAISDGILQHDLGRKLAGRFVPETKLLEPGVEIRGVLVKLRTEQAWELLQTDVASNLEVLKGKIWSYGYPGTRWDSLFRSDYLHKNRGEEKCEECAGDDGVCMRSIEMTCQQLGCKSLGMSRKAGNFPAEAHGLLDVLFTTPYLDRKNRNPDEVQADPGCGKSALAKHLVEDVIPNTTARKTCYFFFKDDVEDQKTMNSALSCVLHQLYLILRASRAHAPEQNQSMPEFKLHSD